MIKSFSVDYNTLWQNSYSSLSLNNDREGIKNMSKKEAEAYAAFPNVWEDGRVRAAGIRILPGETVLEIGAGPGIVSFELAAKAKSLTAVEPAAGMLQVLSDEANKRGITNIETVQAFWEDYEVKTQYDVVVASLSLITKDITGFLAKMNAACRKRAYIHWFASETSWEKQARDIAEITGEESYASVPKINIVFNILYEMNILSEIRILKTTSFDRIFDSKEDALTSLKKVYAVKTDRYDSAIFKYIEKNYIQKNGLYIYPDTTRFAEIIWEKE
ncbi:methyltransferase domain-containing protein [Treponema pedis str. T A4]|uniref:Methyltransferase domain-containing protein n=2 Tax=Treponema pedis TaxID=409322 RepID=S6A395_9SPIR|nr:methyltransferase domain-containing protein [Treponema pedis str. T A4]